MRKTIVLLILFGLVFGCKTTPKRQVGEEWIVEKTGEIPGWITKIPDTKGGIMYFRGLKTQAATIDGGLTDAREHAARQLAEMVGANVNVDYESARVEYGIPKDDKDIGSVVRDLTIVLSKAMIQGLKEKESYWEKWGVQEVSGVRYFRNVYLLTTVTKEDYQRIANSVFEKELEKAREAKNKKAEEFLERMRKDLDVEKYFQE